MAVLAGGLPRSPQFVGMAFVEEYYNCFYQVPEDAYKYYEEASVLSRPAPNGVMSSVTTKQGIKDMILSLGNTEIKAEILTTDSQQSHHEGVIVLVTGCLTGKDSMRRKFTQTFFLAPHTKGYYVLNDIFRYIDAEDLVKEAPLLDNGVDEKVNADSLNANHAINLAPHQPIPEQIVIVEEVAQKEIEAPARVELAPVIKKRDIPTVKQDSMPGGIVTSAESASSNSQVDPPKKISYASVVMKVNVIVAPIQLPVSHRRTESTKAEQKLPEKTEQKARGSSPHVGSADSTPKINNDAPEVKNHCVFVRNLPASTRREHVERIMKKYGTIKQGGIQVRNYRYEPTCYAFVDFETTNDMENAIKASPINYGDGRELTVEEKTTLPGGNNRSRNPPKDGFRNEQIKERKNFNGVRGNGRSEGRVKENSPRTRAPIEIDADGFQLVRHNGGGRAAAR